VEGPVRIAGIIEADQVLEALGLLALCRILFGGFGRDGGHRRSSSGRGCEWWRKRARRPAVTSATAGVSVEGES
jgi:hypothetical protein